MPPNVWFPQVADEDNRISLYLTPLSTPLGDPTLTEEDILLVLLGPTGSGKSTFINQLTGRERVAVGHTLCSCTKAIELVQCDPLPGQKNRLFLVDTPGFDDSGTTDLQILEMLAEWFTETFKQRIKVSGILFFHRITDNRYGASCAHYLELLQNMCGGPSLKSLFIVTSMWDEITLESQQEAVDRERQLKETYWSTLMKRGSQVMRHKGTAFSALTIINHVKPVKLDLKIQLEMVNQRKSLAQTTAGKTVHTRLQKLVEDIKALLATCHASEHDKRAKLTAQFKILQAQLDRFHPASILHFPTFNFRRHRASSVPSRVHDSPLPTPLVFKDHIPPGQPSLHDPLQKAISLIRSVIDTHDCPKALTKIMSAAYRIASIIQVGHETAVDPDMLALIERLSKFGRSAVVRDGGLHGQPRVQDASRSLLGHLQQLEAQLQIQVQESRYNSQPVQNLITDCHAQLTLLSNKLKITAPATLPPLKTPGIHARFDQRFEQIELRLNIKMTELQTCRCSSHCT